MICFKRNSIVLLLVLFMSTSFSLGQGIKVDHLKKVKQKSKEVLNDTEAKVAEVKDQAEAKVSEAKAKADEVKDEAEAKVAEVKDEAKAKADEAKAKIKDGKKTSKLKLNKKFKGKIKGIKRWITLTKIV